MAESSAVPSGATSGRYASAGGHSLDDVESLSRALPERIGKGYLSRCENGRQRVAFSKIITLCRVYDVPSEVLIERMELDLELDRVGGPETEGLEFEELTNRGRIRRRGGLRGKPMGTSGMRLGLLSHRQLNQRFRDATEQHLTAIMNYTIVVSRHGRNSLALHELEYVRSVDGLGPRRTTTLLELLSQRYRSLGDLNRARDLLDEAVGKADSLGSSIHRAFTYADKAFLESDCENHDEAIELYTKAFSLFQEAGSRSGCSRVLLNLAQVYFNVGRLRSSKRALAAAERIAVAHDLLRDRALARVLSGEIAIREDEPSKALLLWREAIDIARKLHDPVVRFKAEFQLYKHAVDSGDTSSASSMKRLLRRRASWVPDNLEELREFKRLST